MAKSKIFTQHRGHLQEASEFAAVVSAAPKDPEQATRDIGQVDAGFLSTIRSPLVSHRLVVPGCIMLDRQAAGGKIDT